MHYKDLSKYTYMSFLNDKRIPNDSLNVGWLEKSVPYTKGNVENESFIEKIFEIVFCEEKIHLTRGFQPCTFCNNFDEKLGVELPIVINWNDKKLKLGSGILVIENEGKRYVFPDLIIHYISAHDYLPPKEFIDAVMKYKIKAIK